MGVSIESRFEAYCQPIVAALAHADRQQPAQWYLKGLMLPGERKSVEPMAARVCPENVRSAHQSMHHLVSAADWDDRAVLAAVAQQVVPELLKKDEHCWWILDDTGHAKKGTHSVGVARQYCGRLGKTDNCQIAVSLSLANARGSLPLDYRLYLPKEWTDERARCRAAGVPEEIEFHTKGELARAEVQAALTAGVPRGVVLGDAAYGDEAGFRDWLIDQQLDYILAVRSQTGVWWGKHQPAQPPPAAERGRPRVRMIRDARHQPISVLEVARALPQKSWRNLTWREGSNGMLSSRFVRVRVRAAHRDRARTEEWLLIEWPLTEPEPTHYWLSTLPERLPFKKLVAQAKGRWMIERDYQELKSELGLSHYEGRNWRGFHHHATLCIAAYGFLMLERLSGKKNFAQLKGPAVPETFRPRGSGSDAATRTRLDRHDTLPSRTCHRSNAASVPVLRETVASANMTNFITQ
jgi:SRSO17 transposase